MMKGPLPGPFAFFAPAARRQNWIDKPPSTTST